MSGRRRLFAALLSSVMLVGLLIGVGQGPAEAAAGGTLVPLLLKDVNPGPASSSPSRFTVAGANLFFSATDGATGQEWQRTDGTTAGTAQLSDIRPGFKDAGISSNAVSFGGRLFFGADDGTFGNELWSTDGTASGTVIVKDINPGAGSGGPTHFAVVGSTLFFVASENSTGPELWKTDGTADGTVLVKDIRPGAGGGLFEPAFTAVGHTVFFRADDGTFGTELWKSDGTADGTVLVRDISPGPSGSSVEEMVVVGDTAFFSASNAANAGNRELWKSDGTATGTVLVKDIEPTHGSGPADLTVVGATVYFSAADSISNRELWKSDGTLLGTVLVKDIYPGNLNSSPRDLTALGGSVLFRAIGPSPAGGAELWRSDGTSAGTVLVKDIFPGASSGNPTGFAVVETTAFFSATDGSSGAAHGTELWSTDGTTAGTVLVGDINPGTASSSPSSLTPALGTLFFTATDGVRGVEPWRLRLNRAPVAGDDAYWAKIDSPRIVTAPGVLGNDTDADGDVLTAGSASSPANGTVTLKPDGSFTYMPNPGFTGTDSFTYLVSDGLGGADTATVTLSVAAVVNQAPSAANDAYSTSEDTPLTVPSPGVVGNDTDADGDTLSATMASGPTNGSVSLNADGSFAYTPNPNLVGTDAFTYTVSDGFGGTTTGTVTVTVAAMPDAPVAGSDIYSTNSAQPPLRVRAPGVLGNDTDADGDSLTAGSASPPAHGTVTLNPDGSFTYTPSVGFGGVDTFTYVVSDATGRSATGTVTVNVFNESSVTSVKGSGCSYSTHVALFGGPGTLQGCGEGGRPAGPTPDPGSEVAADPSYSPHVALPADGSGGSMTAADADGATARYGPAVIHGGIWPPTVGGGPPSGPQAASTSGNPPGGSVTSSASIRLRDVPDPEWPGGFGPMPVEGDSLHVECSASKTAVTGSTTFSNAILVTSTDADGEPVNQEPVPDNPPVNYTRHGVITHVGDVFSVVYNQQIVNADGSLTVNAVHMYLFGPTAVGEVIRGSVTCGTNPTPLTPTDTVAPTCGTPVVKPKGPSDPTPMVPRQELVGVFDAGNGGNTGIQSITNIQVTNGTVEVGNSKFTPFTPGQTGPLPMSAKRTDESRPMSWSFDVTDVTGNTSHCRGAESPPVAGDDVYTTPAGRSLSVPAPGVLANDTDPNGDPLSAGTPSDPPNGSVVLNPNGSFTYVPDPLFTGRDTFTYVVSDGKGGSDTGLVTILVGVANRVPAAVDDTVTTDEDLPLTVPAPGVLGNDTDADGDPLTAGSASAPGNGTVILNGDGSYTYTPKPGFAGTDTFTYTASDGFGGTDTGLVTVTVAAVNDAPVAVDDAYGTNEDRPLTVPAPGLVGNDTDPDGDALSSELATIPANGAVTVNVDGSFTYTPNLDFNGTDTFTYTVSDGQGGWDTGTVTVNVAAVNDAPTAVDDAYDTNEDTPVTLAAPGVVGNDTDPDGNPLSAGSATAPAHGTVTLNADGSFTYTPNANYAGPDTFTYKANDGTSDSNVATVAVTVKPVNDVPVAAGDAYTTGAGVALTVDPPGVLGNDTDADGDPLTAGSASDPANGAVAVNADGSFTYTPDAGFSGSDTFTYAAADPAGANDAATVTITVTPPPPTGDTRPTQLSVADTWLIEGDGATATFTITRAGNTSGASTVKYRTGTGTATAGTDYTPIGTATSVTFAPGETTKTVDVAVTGDTLPEANETFTLVLSAPSVGTVLADASGAATIRNDDGAAYLAVDSVTVTEANTDTSAELTITRSGNTTGASTVKYKTVNGTAGIDDFTAVPLTSVTFDQGQTTKTVAVNVKGDTLDEKNETFTLALSAPVGATVADAAGTATIVDDEGTVVLGPSTFLSVDNVLVNEGNTGVTPAVFTVTRTGNTNVASTVKYRTSGGNATAGPDYTGITTLGTLSFAAGDTTKTVTVDVAGDGLPETDETFNLVLSTPTGAVIADASGTATIVNDDGYAYLAVDNVTVNEGNTGVTQVTFTVTRTGNTTGASTVKVRTSGGTATAGSDYTAVGLTTVDFAADETTKAVIVDVLTDTVKEANETVNLALTTPVGATVSDAAGTATIVNDDA